MKKLNWENPQYDLFRAARDYVDDQDGREHGTDNCNLMGLIPDLLTLQNNKERQYGRSWCMQADPTGMGDVSAYFNLRRKYDRIDHIMQHAIQNGVTDTLFGNDGAESGTATETFIDTLVDAGLYALMWVGLIRERYPALWEAFRKNNGLLTKDT